MHAYPNYKKTLLACYLGFITQAIAANYAPLLFLTFKSTYAISLDRIALIPMIFFLTQLLTDLAAVKFVDRIGYRTCVVASQILSAIGLISMSFLPELLPIPFMGILVSVVLVIIAIDGLLRCFRNIYVTMGFCIYRISISRRFGRFYWSINSWYNFQLSRW